MQYLIMPSYHFMEIKMYFGFGKSSAAFLSESVWVHQWQKAISLSQNSCILCLLLWANTRVWRSTPLPGKHMFVCVFLKIYSFPHHLPFTDSWKRLSVVRVCVWGGGGWCNEEQRQWEAEKLNEWLSSMHKNDTNQELKWAQSLARDTLTETHSNQGCTEASRQGVWSV